MDIFFGTWRSLANFFRQIHPSNVSKHHIVIWISNSSFIHQLFQFWRVFFVIFKYFDKSVFLVFILKRYLSKQICLSVTYFTINYQMTPYGIKTLINTNYIQSNSFGINISILKIFRTFSNHRSTRCLSPMANFNFKIW